MVQHLTIRYRGVARMPIIEVEVLPVIVSIEARMRQDAISLRQAAEDLDVTHPTLANWLRGISRPKLTADLQRRLASFLGVSPRRVVELFDLDVSSEALRPYLTSAA